MISPVIVNTKSTEIDSAGYLYLCAYMCAYMCACVFVYMQNNKDKEAVDLRAGKHGRVGGRVSGKVFSGRKGREK